MNCDQVRTKLDGYVENELATDERAAVEHHLETCSSCRRRLTSLQQITALLYQIPAETPAPDLAGRIMATIETRMPQSLRYRLWLHTAAVGLGLLFAAYLLLALGYQTLLTWQQGGAGQFISLLLNDPELIGRYPAKPICCVRSPACGGGGPDAGKFANCLVTARAACRCCGPSHAAAAQWQR